MSEITLRNVCKEYDKGHFAVKDFNLDIQRQGIHHLCWPLRLRQVHHTAHDRRTGGYQRRRTVDRWRTVQLLRTQGQRAVYGISELCPISQYDSIWKPGLRPEDPEGSEKRN